MAEIDTRTGKLVLGDVCRPSESLVSISLDRGDVGKDFMVEIDTHTGKLVLGDVCRPSVWPNGSGSRVQCSE